SQRLVSRNESDSSATLVRPTYRRSAAGARGRPRSAQRPTSATVGCNGIASATILHFSGASGGGLPASKAGLFGGEARLEAGVVGRVACADAGARAGARPSWSAATTVWSGLHVNLPTHVATRAQDRRACGMGAPLAVGKPMTLARFHILPRGL